MEILNILISYILMLLAILTVISIHEFSHAGVATLLGDPTPRNEGRLTLNPLKHIDPIGLLLFVLIHFGWSKPVKVNATYFKDHKKGRLWVAAAGPLSNLIGAFLFGFLLKIFLLLPLSSSSFNIYLLSFLRYGVEFNIIFMLFNLLPIPPLDGSQLLFSFLSPSSYFKMLQYEKLLHMLLLLLLLMGVIPNLLMPLASLIVNLIFGIFHLL